MSSTNSVASRSDANNARSSRTSITKPGSPSPLKRLTHEITDLRENPNPAVLHLGPSTDSDLFTWECVLKGPPAPSMYSGGLWLLSLKIPSNYPTKAPDVRFITPICHPNINFETGEICLSLLTSEHWTPRYTLSDTMTEIQRLLAIPGLDSPFNVDAGNLAREDDGMGLESLVRFWTSEKRWQGEGEAGWISERNDTGRISTAGHIDPSRQVHRESDVGAMAEKDGREDNLNTRRSTSNGRRDSRRDSERRNSVRDEDRGTRTKRQDSTSDEPKRSTISMSSEPARGGSARSRSDSVRNGSRRTSE